MGNVRIDQPGGAGTLLADGNVVLGTRCYLSAIGVTALSWAVISKPIGSNSVAKNHPVRGWYFDPDVGPGKYVLRMTDSVSATHDGTFDSISAPATGPAQQVYNICDFGAVPSTSPSVAARNTVAMFSAAAAANAAGGGRVYVPTGSYGVTTQNTSKTASPLYMVGFSNVTFVGDGPYASTLVDVQAMSTDASSGAPPNIGIAFFTFVDCIKCGVIGIGMTGANQWSQARLNTGITIVSRKGAYFAAGASGGCKDCFLINCYLANIEGEAAFADGAVDGWRVWDNHFYRCQSNVVNWAAGNSVSVYRNRIEDPGQSAFQFGGTNVSVGCNVVTMSTDPATGNPWLTAGDVVLIAHTSGVLVHDNVFYNLWPQLNTVNIICIGQNDPSDTSDVAIIGNIIEGANITTGVGNHNAVINVDAAVGAIKNLYVGGNRIVNCRGAASGGAYRAAIRASGGLACGGTIAANYVDNSSTGSLDVGVYFDSALLAGNTLRLETQQIRGAGVLVAPHVMDVAAFDDARTLVGSKTWDPANVADGAMTSTTVTIGGCRVGDAGVVSFTGAGVVAGIIFSAIATATDVMTVTMFNKSGGAVDLGSGTLTVHVTRT